MCWCMFYSYELKWINFRMCLHCTWLLNICDPLYDLRDEGDSMLTTGFLKTTEARYNMVVKHARACFNELINAFVSCNTLQTIKCAPLNNEAWAGKQAKCDNLQIQKLASEQTQHTSV